MLAGLDHLVQLLQDHRVMQSGSVWLLLLSLFVLQQLSEGTSAWADYVQLLPCPLVAAPMLCPSGPPTPHVMFFRSGCDRGGAA